MIDYTELKADIESGDINERNIVCEIGKGGFMVSVLKWLSDVAISLGADLAAIATTIATNTGASATSLATLVTRTPAPALKTPGLTLATGNGSVVAGQNRVTIHISTDFSGTINGVAVNPAHFRSLTWEAGNRDTLGNSIPYTIAAGSLLITTVA